MNKILLILIFSFNFLFADYSVNGKNIDYIESIKKIIGKIKKEYCSENDSNYESLQEIGHGAEYHYYNYSYTNNSIKIADVIIITKVSYEREGISLPFLKSIKISNNDIYIKCLKNKKVLNKI